jgi:hypothetical protein
MSHDSITKKFADTVTINELQAARIAELEEQNRQLHAAYEALAASTADRRREEGERATQAASALAGAFAGLGAGRKARKG